MMQIEASVQNAKPTIDAYFQSISAAFEATLKTQDAIRYDGETTSIVFFALVLFSLIPVIPAILYFTLGRFLVPIVYSFWSVNISTQSFLFWYLFSSAISSLIFGFRLKYSSFRKRNSESAVSKEDLLTDSQMRFALCYAVQSEIDLYRTNKRTGHIEKATKLWWKFLYSLRRPFGARAWPASLTEAYQQENLLYHAYPDEAVLKDSEGLFFRQIHVFTEQFSWFRLDPRTEEVIKALDGLRSKLSGRITGKKDLFEVSESLFSFDLYLYCQIPDIADTDEEKRRLAEIANLALESFTAKMASIDAYSVEVQSPTTSSTKATSKTKLGELLGATVSNPATFLRFCSAWVIVQIVVGIAVLIFVSTVKGLKLDSTLTALLVGTPFAVAAALTAIPPIRSNEKDSIK